MPNLVKVCGEKSKYIKHNYEIKLCYVGSGSEWHSDKMTRSSNRHGASLWHEGSLWHSDKMTRCVTLAQRQNNKVRHFGTATK